MKALLLFFIFINTCLAQELEYPEIIPNKLPLEFELAYNGIANTLIPDEKDAFLLLSMGLQENFQKMNSNQRDFLIKTTILKFLLQYQFDFYIQNIDVNRAFLAKIEQKLNSNKSTYSDFSQWLIKSILADMSEFKKDEALDQLSVINKSNEADMRKLALIKRKLKYIGPWFYVVDKMKPEEFNALMREASWRILKMIRSYSRLLTFYSGIYSVANTDTFFKLPPIPEQLKDTSFEEFLDLKDSLLPQIIPLGEKQVNEAQKLMDSIDIQENKIETSPKGSDTDQWRPSEFDNKLILPE